MTTQDGLSRLHQIALPVRDIERATRFYRDVLGVSFLFSAPPGLAFFDCGGVRLMLSGAEGEGVAPGSMLYFGVDDIHAAHEQLASRGVTFGSAPHLIATLADREVWLVDFKDSEGNPLALMSEPLLPVRK